MASMDYVFKITDNKSGTVTLTSSPISYYSGGVVTASHSQATVGDTLSVRIKDGSGTANLDELATVNRLLRQAEDAQAGYGVDRVYLTWQAGASADIWRSEIMRARAEPREDALKYGFWSNDRMFANIYFERANYWEGPEATITVYNRAGTATGGTIVNHQDAGATDDFYVSSAANQVTGSLPTPAIIQFTNTTNNASLVDRIFVGHFADTSSLGTPVATTNLILESSGTADANCSGNGYSTYSWTGTGENLLATWTIASALFQQRPYRVIARLRDATEYTDLYVKAKLMQGIITIAETRWELVSAGESLVEIGSITIPPFGWGAQVNLGDLTVNLYEKRAGGNGSINLDFMALMPQDSWRALEAIGGLAYGETLIDDPVERTMATNYDTTSYKVTQKLAAGGPIMLRPSVANTLYFLHDLTDGSAPIARTSAVVVKYRPRRLSL